MTPLELEILIHCYVTPGEHPRKDAPAVKEVFDKFKTDGIIESAFNRLTEKGMAWLEVILNTPYPKRVWIEHIFGNFINEKEEGILEEKLCWKCKEYIILKYGNASYFPPFQHCHHEPKDKPKCEECQDGVLAPLYRPVRLNADIKISKFCPECGRKRYE